MRTRTRHIWHLLLALVLAFGPGAGAFASAHPCGPRDGDPPMAGPATPHAAMHGDTVHTMAKGGHAGRCPGCSSDCCKTKSCAPHACGAGVVALTVSYETPRDIASSTASSTVQLVTPNRRPTPFFRPPRV